MNNRIKASFDIIHAEEALKDNTIAFLSRQTHVRAKRKGGFLPYAAITAACLVFLLLSYGGFRVYFTPTAIISIDINPSLELGINRFSKVVSVAEYNDDGTTLARSVHVKYMNYTDAIDQILETSQMTELMSQDEVLVITVSGSDETQCHRLLTQVESCTSRHKNAYCYAADSADTATAHELGLSCGKYHALLKLQAMNPDITPEDIQNMTMKEIHELIHSDSDSENGSAGKNGHHGSGHGHGHK